MMVTSPKSRLPLLVVVLAKSVCRRFVQRGEGFSPLGNFIPSGIIAALGRYGTIQTFWRLHMRCLLILLCLMFATSVANAHPRVSHVQVLNYHEPLPRYVQKESMAGYAEWARLHNRAALQAAYDKHDRLTYHIPPTTVTTKQYSEYSTATGRRGLFSLPNRYESNRSERTITRTYSRDTWSGGPVLLINPYFRN